MSTRTISTLEELKAFRDEVNAGNTFKGETIELANDIDLGGEEWTPIGNAGNSFQGNFNGNGHTISNLKVNLPTSENAGFFGTTKNGTVKNLNFHNADIKGSLNVGVVAGTPYTTSYSNITVTGDVEVNGFAYVGGMFGKNGYADLTDLTMSANSGSYVKADSQGYRSYVGGIIGFMGEGNQTVMNVTSNINVIGSTCDVGGIAGIAHYGNKFVNVTCTANAITLIGADDLGDQLEIGGIVGVWHNQDGKIVQFINCSAANVSLSSAIRVSDGNGGYTYTYYNEQVKDNEITGRSYSSESTTSGTLITGQMKTIEELGTKFVFILSGPNAEADFENLYGALNPTRSSEGYYYLNDFSLDEIYVNYTAWNGKKNGDMVENGIIGVNAFAESNDAINAAGADAVINIQDSPESSLPITRQSYRDNLTVNNVEDGRAALNMTAHGTYVYGEEAENGDAVRHDATVAYNTRQDINFGGHSHFESLAGMTVKFTNQTQVTHNGGTPFFKVYGDSNVVFDQSAYLAMNGNTWVYVSGKLDFLNGSMASIMGGSGMRILAAGGSVNVENSNLLVQNTNISIGSYYVYSDKTAKAIVGGKKQGHDTDGSNIYTASFNVTGAQSALMNSNGFVRVGASYILDNAASDDLEGLTILDNPDKPADYADLAKAELNITDNAYASLDKVYVDGNGTLRIDNATMKANSLVNNGEFLISGTSAVNLQTVSGNAAKLNDAILTDSTLGDVKVYGENSIRNSTLGNVTIGFSDTDSTASAKLAVNGDNNTLGIVYLGQDEESDRTYKLDIGTGEFTEAPANANADQLYIRQNGTVTVKNGSSLTANYMDIGGKIQLDGGYAEVTGVNLFIRGRSSKNAYGKALLHLTNGAVFKHSATGPNALLVLGGTNGDGYSEGTAQIIADNSSIEAESILLKDGRRGEAHAVYFDTMDTRIRLRDTLTVGTEASATFNGNTNLEAKTVTLRGYIGLIASSMTVENLTVNADATLWSTRDSVITVTGNLSVDSNAHFVFEIDDTSTSASILLIKGYDGIDYTNITVQDSAGKGYVKVVGKDNNLYAIAGSTENLYSNAAWDGLYSVGDTIPEISESIYGFNAFASAKDMFDAVGSETRTLNLFGEQELFTDAAAGAAENYNFNIRASNDLLITAENAATLKLTVKDTSWAHGGSTNNTGELAFISNSDDSMQTITIDENVTIDTNAKVWFGRTAVTREVHATNIVINGSIIQKPHKDAAGEHPTNSLYGIQQIQVDKDSTVTLNGYMQFGWSLLIKGATFNVTENATLTWDVNAFALSNGNVELEARDESKAKFNVSGSRNVNLRSLNLKDEKSEATFTDGANAVFSDAVTIAAGASITIDAASEIKTGVLTNYGTITVDATGITSGTYRIIDTDGIASQGSISASGLTGNMRVAIADNDIYLTDQSQKRIYVGGVNASGVKNENTKGVTEGALKGWNMFDTMKDAFNAGALGDNVIDFGDAGRTVSSAAFIYTSETVKLGLVHGEATSYTITGGKGAYLPRILTDDRDVTVEIKNADVTLSKFRDGKNSAEENLGGTVFDITNSKIWGGNEVDNLAWVTLYKDSRLTIDNTSIGMRHDAADLFADYNFDITGNTGNYLDWGSYGNLALKVAGTADISNSTVFAGYCFETLGDEDGAAINLNNTAVYVSSVTTNGKGGHAELNLNNSALRQSGWGNGTENYDFVITKNAVVSLENGSSLWWAKAAQVRTPYGGALRDAVTIDEDGTLSISDSTAEVGNITNNGLIKSTAGVLNAELITNNGNIEFLGGESELKAEFNAAGTGSLKISGTTFGAGTRVNMTSGYTKQDVGTDISITGSNTLTDGAVINTGWSKNLKVGFGSSENYAQLSIKNGSALNVGGVTYIGSESESQGNYWVYVDGDGSEFNGNGAAGDLYLRKDGNLNLSSKAKASFSYFNAKGLLIVDDATFKALDFTTSSSASFNFTRSAQAELGNGNEYTFKGDFKAYYKSNISVNGHLRVGDERATLFLVSASTLTVNGALSIGYSDWNDATSEWDNGLSRFRILNGAHVTAVGDVEVKVGSSLEMDYKSCLTFGDFFAADDSITIDVRDYTDGVYKVMDCTGSLSTSSTYSDWIYNWAEIENIGYTIVNDSLFIGKADAENYLVNKAYSKYKFGDAIEGKTGYFYGFNAFSSLDEAGRAVKEATRTITVEADLTEDVNTPLFDLKGDLILTAEAPVTVTWNVIGNAADAPDTDGKVYLVSKDGLNHTFTIGENVTLNVPQSSWGGAFYVGYQSAWATKLNIDGKVNTYLFYIGSNSEVTVSETGRLTTTNENLIMRWGSKLTVNGNGTLDENNPQVKLSYASIQGGDLVLNNTVMNAGSWLQMWNRNKVDGKQAPALTMDNSVLIAGGLTASDAEEAVISLNNNSTVKINGNAANAGTMSVTDSVLNVDGTLTNSGTINVYGESSIKTIGVSNTGMIILNDGTTLIDSTIMDSTENTVAYGNVTVRNSHFGTLVFSGNSGASVNGALEGAVDVDNLMVDRRYNDAVSDDITGTLTVKADANIGVSKHMYNKVGSTTVIEANAIVTVTGELQNKGTINVEGSLHLFSENGLGESVAGRDKNKGVMNVNGGNVYYADGSSSNGWFGIGAKIHNAGWENVQEAGSEMNLSNNALLDLTFNGGNEYPAKYGAAFAIGTGATLNVESGSTVKANSALLNKGTVNLDGTSSITIGDLINEASGKINVKAGKNVSFKAGALTNNGEFAVDGGSYQGGTVKVIDLDSITGAEIIVNNIDSKYVYRGDDGDVLFSDASKEILKGNTSWSSIAFGDAVTEAGTDFYKGVNAFDNGTGLWAQFEENVTTEVEIGAGDFTDGNVTSASHRFIGGKNVVIRSTAAGDDYAVLSKDSTFEYGVADEATIDADYTITLEGNQQYDWLQVRAAQKDWQTGSTEAGKQIKLNADGTAQAPDHLITLNVNGKVIAKTLNVKEGTLINIDASKGGSLTGNGNGGGGYVVRGMMNVIGKNGTDFDSEATLNLNGAAFTVGYAPNSSKVRGPAFVNITDKAVVTNIMHSFLNFQAPGSILNVDNAKLDVGHIQEATAGNASSDFTFNVKNKADVHAKNSIVLGQDAQNGDDGIFSFNVENSTVAADWNIELKTFSDTTLSTSKMSAAKDFILNGNLSMQNVSTLTVGGNFTNTGSISVGSGSSLDVGNTFINQGTFNLNWNASLKMGSFDATSSSITIDMTGFDNKEHALVVVNNTTLDETAVISIVGQDFYDKYKGYLRYDGNTLYLTENLSAEVYVSSAWAGKGQGETVDYNGNTYTIGTNAFGTVEEAKAVNPLLIHIVDGTITGTTVLDGQKTIMDGDATYTAVVLAGARVAAGVDNRVTIDGDTNVTVNGGTFKSHLIGADGQISGSIRRNGNVTLTINGGDFEKQIAGGMYFYAQNPFDEAVLVGDVNMTINGGTFVKRVYGGCFTQLENEYTAQTKIVGDINLTIDASVNTITFNNMVTAGSRGTGRIYGDINVKVTGESSNLNFTTKLIGDSNAAGYYNTANGYTEQTYVSGDRIVEFANFQGDFNAELIMFKTLNFSEGTNMTFTSVRLDVSNVSEWNFGFGTELNINAGLNSFEGDKLAFGLDGWDNSSDWTAINGAKDSMIAGWDKAGSVSFFLNGSEYAASWDAAAGAWCNSELGVKLGLGNDQKSLLIGKLA